MPLLTELGIFGLESSTEISRLRRYKHPVHIQPTISVFALGNPQKLRCASRVDSWEK
jgi:hypothetical protein